MLSDWLIAEPSYSSAPTLGTLLYLVYMLPLVGPLARWTHVQFSVIAMSLSLYLLWRISQRTFAANENRVSAENVRV